MLCVASVALAQQPRSKPMGGGEQLVTVTTKPDHQEHAIYRLWRPLVSIAPTISPDSLPYPGRDEHETVPALPFMCCEWYEVRTARSIYANVLSVLCWGVRG
jgi:hypothetical protein